MFSANHKRKTRNDKQWQNRVLEKIDIENILVFEIRRTKS